MIDLVSTASVDQAVFSKFPQYSAHLVQISGIKNQSTTEFSDQVLTQVEQAAIKLLSQTEINSIEQVLRWRSAFADFGVKPKDARSSFEALLRRVEKGLPRIDMLTDLYNAMSVKHLMPIGGENATAYQGSPQLVLATGDETFDTTEHGEKIITNPLPGEVIWQDDAGITCRRWNWRQCVRTRLDLDVSSVLFIFDGLGPDSADHALACAAELLNLISQTNSNFETSQRTITAA